MNLDQRLTALEKEVTDLRRQLEKHFDPQAEITSKINLLELRKKRLQKRLEKITDPKQRQAVLDVLAKLDCYIQLLPQRYQGLFL